MSALRHSLVATNSTVNIQYTVAVRQASWPATNLSLPGYPTTRTPVTNPSKQTLAQHDIHVCQKSTVPQKRLSQ